MIKTIREFMFSNEYPLRIRRFVLTGIVGCVAILFVLLSAITSQQGFIFILGLILSLGFFIGTILYTLRSKHYLFGESLLILISNLFILPVGYLLGGGFFSGAPLWYVIGILFVFVLFRGRFFWFYLAISAASFGVSTYLGAVRPEWVVALQEGYSMHLDSYIAMVSVAVIGGILFKFQSAVLERELKRAEEQTLEIENLNEQQNRFFSSMSHEIRTPISTIIGLNEMTMREKKLPAEVLENTLNIQNASKMLLSLINDLLDMSKIQSGKMEIIPSRYETSRMLSEITNLHWNRAMEKELNFDIQVDENIPPVLFGDETRIKQVIINLLTNAIKYTDEGSVTMRFGGERSGANRFLLRVEVEDTGYGIRKENIPYLFDAFRRVDGDNTKNIEGTGLGLAITKQLVEMMDGTIAVNSIYTKGSTFRVEIPQEIVTVEGKDFQRPGLFVQEQPDYQHSFEAPKAAVLIVDDNDMNRIVCRKLLRSTRVQVDLAESGKECLEKTREKHYDAIFMDHEMPQMDGIETLHQLRQQLDGLNKDTPVIALTANAGSDRNAFYLEQGFSAYLSKPIQSSRLESLLLACLPSDLVEQSFVEGSSESLQVSETVSKRPFLITTDSISDLPEDIQKKNEILVMPYYIETRKGRFRDLDEIDAVNLQQFLLERPDQEIHSDAAPVEEYEAFFANALTEARFVLHLSGLKSISMAYENAAMAAESFGNVTVYDAGLLSIGLGLTAIRAAQLFRSGLRIEEVMQDLEQYRKKVQMQYLVPSLSKTKSKYRAPVLPRILMNVFNLEPVFTVKRGRLAIQRFLFGYVRSTVDQFIRFTFLHKKNIKTTKLYVTFSACPMELREHVLEEIERYVHFDEVIVTKASASTFINCGPNAFGLTFEKND